MVFVYASLEWLWVFLLIGSILGIGDGIFNTQLYAIVCTFFEGNAEQAFAG